LTARQQQLLAAWRQLPAPDMRRSHYRCRYVVVDVETTGINVKTDRLCAIGALAVVDGQIDFKDAFHLVLEPAAPADDPAGTSGAGGRRTFDRRTDLLPALCRQGTTACLQRSVCCRDDRTYAGRVPRYRLGLPWIDLAWVMPDLFRDVEHTERGLDAWLNHFAIASIRRHHAVSDAYATAQLLQITIASGARKGFTTPASLLELEKARRHMHQSG
jgi:DNA polymerase-3 subunit epsilon